jgi:hypothetical protein
MPRHAPFLHSDTRKSMQGRSRQKSIFRREPQLAVRELIGQRLRREASVSARPVAEPG